MVPPVRIIKLDPTVVNRIAAGEVIHRPSSAIKELIENCLDAGASLVQITVTGGGFKMFTVQDDGCGIRREDLPIVCQRFTTSKLQKFEDLQKISTYGFRGEALASISHVSRLSIITRTSDSECAFKAHYMDGNLVSRDQSLGSKSTPCAGNVGTKVIVEDLFYNIPARRRAMKKESEEYSRILDIVAKYAIHSGANAEENKTTEGTGFVCKKTKGTSAGVNTSSKMSKLDIIRALYGSGVSNELISISARDIEISRSEDKQNSEDDVFKFSFSGYFSNANYSRKHSTFIIFINSRLVTCGTLKKSIETVYSEFLPKGSFPFVYIALSIPTEEVDVNVHPTKREVHFLNEDGVVVSIQRKLEEALNGSNTSRTFLTQSTLINEKFSQPERRTEQHKVESLDLESSDLENQHSNELDKSTVLNSSKAKREASYNRRSYQPNKLVRTDSKAPAGSIEIFLQNKRDASDTSTASQKEAATHGRSSDINYEEEEAVCAEALCLSSVKNLIQEYEKQQDPKLSRMLRDMVFVGLVDNIFALIQFKTTLYLIDYREMTREMFYQEMLRTFGQCRRQSFEQPLLILELIRMALSYRCPDFSKEDHERISHKYAKLLFEKKEMMEEYFRIRIDGENPETCCIYSLPELLEDYTPLASALPLFILKLCEEATWDNEESCFRSVCWEIAEFYSELPVQTLRNDSQESQMSTVKESREYLFKNIIFPALRVKLIPQREFSERTRCIVMRIACLENLYRVFERC